MKTKEQREKEFMEDLAALLEKHCASIDLVEKGSHNYQPGEDHMEVTLQALYTTDYDCAAEHATFSLGRSIG